MDFSMEVQSREFEAMIDDLVTRLPREAQPQLLKVIAFDFLKVVMLRNPVDTGRSRAAWSLFFDEHPEYSEPRPKKDVDPAEEYEGTLLGEYSEDLRGRDMYIEITNGVPYIVPLEYGHSKQAPAGMVRVAMRVASRNIAKNVRKELEKAIIKADVAAGRHRGT